jgi:hypothetical protein
MNMLCSFTTIIPGKGKDDCWNNDDMCEHLGEVAMIGKWVHRQPSGQQAPKLHFIFDGSSNHAARAADARHVGAGTNKEPGGKCAPVRGTARAVPQYRWQYRTKVDFALRLFVMFPI